VSPINFLKICETLRYDIRVRLRANISRYRENLISVPPGPLWSPALYEADIKGDSFCLKKKTRNPSGSFIPQGSDYAISQIKQTASVRKQCKLLCNIINFGSQA
jgi:hypothetical protein